MSGLAIAMPPPPAADRRIPGNHGIWVGITCEFVEFALLFSVYFIARAHYPEAFAAGGARLSSLAGGAITLLMITSSLFIACAVVSLRAGRRRRSILWLGAGLLAALGYPLVKYLEFGWNLEHGVTGGAGIFFTVYYYLTLTHLVHAFWGILGMLWALGRHLAGAYTPERHDGLEALASYWHATDIVWLAIFPLLYVMA
ncbi:cytochrome c oxidase subunit 3 family protein [Pseudothauera nasutitermitis]|uniref:Cytochrome c oxidase subunit 3 family protein n=1 Tax=Pseudothauera nasutitermitis TaxID=2565930 RepID=A0A4V3WB12_9RHOO|nr:cytochrome c oxidase subunit 3 family protein [Pseudothauera nasutitermitis]THF61475.1 cytochrome c oxidase subunit 3 family protein [Pseudothauera nasutitermitis]